MKQRSLQQLQPLKGRRGGKDQNRSGGKVCVLVAEQLIADLAGQQHPDVRLFVDGLAAEIHAHAGPDGGDVPGAQGGDDDGQGRQNLLPGHIDLRVIGADELRRLPGVLQVDGIRVHADGEGTDLLPQNYGADGAHQGGVQPAGEQEAQGSVRVQPFIHRRDQLVADVAADGLQVIGGVLRDGGEIRIADKFSVRVIVSRREGADPLTQPHQVFRFAGKDDGAGAVIAVVQGPDADGIPGCDELIPLGIVDDEGELRVQLGEHLQAVLPVQRKQDLTVAAAAEGVAFFRQLPLQGAEAVDLAVADHIVPVQLKGLHPRLRQAHDGQPVKAQPAGRRLEDLRHVRSPGPGSVKEGQKFLLGVGLFGKTHNCAHR